jgi:CYTH domain-containing protein
MSDQAPAVSDQPQRGGKYARIERERRFLLAAPPDPSDVVVVRRLTDRYLIGTRLRLRHSQRVDTGEVELKLTQKIPRSGPGSFQGWITNTYLSLDEYEVLAAVPAVTLTKTRISVPPLGIDVFDGHLAGLVLAEAEFDSDSECRAFSPPPCCLHEVTTDPRFTGGRLVHAAREELLTWLRDYDLGPA